MEWDIKQLDVSKMIISPNHPQLVNFIEKEIPLMKSIKVKYTPKNFTKMMLYKYILLMYDPSSPIQSMHSLDFYEKKYYACAYAGYPLKKGKDGHKRFDSRVDEMVLGENEEITDAVINFIGYINSPQWNYLVFLHESMLAFTRDAMGKKNRDSKTSKEFRALYDAFYEISNQIGHVYEETKEFSRRFYRQIEISRSSVKPEDYAKALSDNDELRGDSPYPIDYVPNKLTFIGELPPDE
jgi:hypothetical protein